MESPSWLPQAKYRDAGYPRPGCAAAHIKDAGPESNLGRKPWRRHCGSLDCPEYAVCSRTEQYEVREYSHALWAVTTVQAVNFHTATRQGAEHLAAYFHGNNEPAQAASPPLDRHLPVYNPTPHIFSRAFRHRASDRRTLREALHLWAALDESGIDYLEGQVMVASYNCPWNRGFKKRHARPWHTEVWAHGNYTAVTQ
ncbi:hypothetical protein N2152v2_000348 [Parachlorella kessleri]